MNKKLYNIVKISIAVLSLIGVVLFIRVTSAEDPTELSNAVHPLITFAIVALILTASVAVIFSLLNLIKNPDTLKKSLISLGVLAVLFFISYSLASDATVLGANGVDIAGGEAGTIPKMVGTLIKYTYILAIIGIGCVIWGSVKKMFSNN